MKQISIFLLSLVASLLFASCGDNDTNSPNNTNDQENQTSQKRLAGVTFSCELYDDYDGYERCSFVFNNIRYDTDGRIGSIHFEKQKQYEYGYATEQENAQVRISYIGKTISLSPTGGFSDTKLANFEMNDKGYITKIKGTNGLTDINLELQYDGNKLVRLIMYNYNYGYTYPINKQQIDYTWKNDLITKIERHVYIGFFETDEYYSSSEINYGKNKNKDFIFPINIFFHTSKRNINSNSTATILVPSYTNQASNQDEYDIYYKECVQGYIFNILGQAGLFGICPDLLPISTSTGEFFDYYLDTDGHLVEYVYHPNNTSAPHIATFEYSNDQN